MLAQALGVTACAICADMDAWGYTFRLGSAYAWFTRDAEAARAWLLRYSLIAPDGAPTWRCREWRESRAAAASVRAENRERLRETDYEARPVGK